jgi:hypothetical protein
MTDMGRRGSRAAFWGALVTGALSVAGSFAQTADMSWDWSWRWRRMPPRFPDPDLPQDHRFSFCRILYDSVRREPLGHGWNTDYPDSDINFMTRFEQLTPASISRGAEGEPYHVVVRLTDPELFDYPFIFMSDVGTVGFTDEEVARLREYLLRGGFLHVDDFWGDLAWENWTQELGRVLPPGEYPIVDIPRDHHLLSLLYEVGEVPQIPSIQFWRRSGGNRTSERGDESAEPHLRGVYDRRGRLMVTMTHNTDIADGWEREGEDDEFFYRFSVKAYPLGINIVLYAMSH